ncbi:unnamed protein product [Closterium sp. NIES-54]
MRMADGVVRSCGPELYPVSCNIGECHGKISFQQIWLDSHDIILGTNWLAAVNPQVDWRTREVKVLFGGRSVCLPVVQQQEEMTLQLISAKQFGKAIQGEEAVFLGLITEVQPTSPEAAIPTVSASHEDKELTWGVEKLLEKISGVFPEDLPAGLPPKQAAYHRIELIPGSTPPVRPTYKMSAMELKELKKQLEDLLAKEFIQPSSSPYASPVLFVWKKDGSLRMCVDYRGLNKITVKNRYPLPQIDELFEQVGEARYFSKLDLRSGYHQVRIQTTFQGMMQSIFSDFIDKFLVIFIDDLLVYSRTREEHLKHLELVLARLSEHRLYAKRSKFTDHTTAGAVGSVSGAVRPQPTDCVQTRALQSSGCLSWPAAEELNAMGVVTWDRNFITPFSRGYNRDQLYQQKASHDPSFLFSNPFWTRADSGTVCDDSRLRQLLLHEYHDNRSHFGSDKTYAAISRDYYWPGLSRSVAEYVALFPTCQVNKARTTAPADLLQPLEIPTAPWTCVSLDFITDLPRTPTGFDSILVVIDKLSKMAHFIPTTGTVTAAETAKLFFTHVVRLHRLPSAIISDRDTRFLSNFWTALFQLLGTQIRLSTAYHPETDGQTKRMNGTLEDALCSCVNAMQTDWDQHLAAVEFAYNSSPNVAMGEPPILLATGQLPRSVTSLPHPLHSPNPTAADFISSHHRILQLGRRKLQLAQECQVRCANQHRRHTTFKVGDLVLLSTPNLPLLNAGTSPKLAPRFVGPFPITKVLSPVSYRLQLPPHMTIHLVFHVHLLRPYHTPSHPFQPRPPMFSAHPDLHEVDTILSHCDTSVGREYLIHWRNTSASEDSWEPFSNLSHAPRAIGVYLASLAPRMVPSGRGGNVTSGADCIGARVKYTGGKVMQRQRAVANVGSTRAEVSRTWGTHAKRTKQWFRVLTDFGGLSWTGGRSRNVTRVQLH